MKILIPVLAVILVGCTSPSPEELSFELHRDSVLKSCYQAESSIEQLLQEIDGLIQISSNPNAEETFHSTKQNLCGMTDRLEALIKNIHSLEYHSCQECRKNILLLETMCNDISPNIEQARSIVQSKKTKLQNQGMDPYFCDIELKNGNK